MNIFRKDILELCSYFDLPKPTTVRGLAVLCEYIMFQGQLEFTEESILDLKIRAEIEGDGVVEIHQTGEEME